MTSTEYHRAVRNGAMAATRLHQKLGVQKSLENMPGSVDVFGAIFSAEVPLLLRPLKGLLGAFVRFPDPGILITTLRPQSIQRLTAAHELGHFILNHNPSLDDDKILRRIPHTNHKSASVQEIEADAFAIEFLMPRWLIIKHCQLHGWQQGALLNPIVTYQLSLRLGSSYEALCWTLLRNKIITALQAKRLTNIQPKSIKKELLRGYEPADYRADVWLITESDDSTQIAGCKDDLFIMEAKEHTSGGYVWDFEQFEAAGFLKINDCRKALDESGVGGEVVRRFTTQASAAFQGILSFNERRLWDPQSPINKISFAYDLTGPEQEGLSRAEKRYLLESA